jgi:hypothetical protein
MNFFLVLTPARAIGYFGRGLSVARAYARVRAFPSRKAPNNYLRHIPLFLRTIANNTLQYRADVLLVGWLSALFGTENTGKVASALVPNNIQDGCGCTGRHSKRRSARIRTFRGQEPPSTGTRVGRSKLPRTPKAHSSDSPRKSALRSVAAPQRCAVVLEPGAPELELESVQQRQP